MGVTEIEKLERRHAENPNGTVFAVLADHYRRVGDIGRALDLLGPGLALHPEYIPASIVLGRCHLALGDDVQAEGAFTRVLSLDPENVIALRELAGITERQGRLDDAERWVRMLLLIDRDSEEAKEQLARLEEARRAAPPTVASTPAEPAPPASPGIEAAAVEAFEPPAPVAPDLPTAEPAAISGPPPATEPEPAASAPAPVADLPLEAPPATVEMEPLAGLVVEETAYGWVAPAEDATEAEVAVFGELDLEPGAGSADVVRTDDIQLVSSMSGDFERYDMAAQLDASAAAPSDDGLEAPADAAPEPETSVVQAPPVEPVSAVSRSVAEVDLDEAPADVEPEPVLTETMAELYARQGHHAEAVAVYRGLLERQPGDPRLQARLGELEAALAAVAPPPRRVRAAETGGLSVAGLFARMLAAAPAADRPAAPAATYDEFFAAPAAADAAPAADVAADAGDADDLAQFQAWLQKLKR